MIIPEEKIILNNQGDYLVDDEIYDKHGNYKCRASLSLIKLIYCGLPEPRERGK